MTLNKIIFTIVLLCSANLYPAEPGWIVPPTNVALSMESSSDVVNSSANSSGEFLVTWTDSFSTLPMYAVYNSLTESWSPVQTVASTSVTSEGPVFSSVNSSGDFMVTWIENTSPGQPKYTIYHSKANPPFWDTVDNVAHSIESSGSFNAISSCIDSTGDFLVVWADATSIPQAQPKYSIYHSTTRTWNPPAFIATEPSPFGLFFSSVNSSGDFMATWADSASQPRYSIFHSKSTMSWDPPKSITPSTTESAVAVFPEVNPSGDFMVTWANFLSNQARYSIYSSKTGAFGSAFDLTPTPESLILVASSANSLGDFMATWIDPNSPDQRPRYSIYRPQTAKWDPAQNVALVPGSSYAVIFPSVSRFGDFMVAWPDQTEPHQPLYAIYRSKETVVGSGVRVVVRALLQTRIANKLTWGTIAGAISYQVYSDQLLHNLLYQGEKPEFIDPNVTDGIQNYYVIWIDNTGNPSPPTKITIQ